MEQRQMLEKKSIFIDNQGTQNSACVGDEDEIIKA